MTATVIAFPFNDQRRPDEQRQRVGPASLLMEAQAIYEAATLYRDAAVVRDQTAAIGQMQRLLLFGSPAAREAACVWIELVLGLPPSMPAPVLVDYGPFEGVPGGANGGHAWSDYAD